MKQYTEQINSLKEPTFQQIRGIAVRSISHLSKTERDKLWEKLNHGVELLDSHELMCQYLFSYGNMHEAKIRDAVKFLPKEIVRSEFEIVDWGCGQGIGTICLFDYLRTLGYNSNVKKVTLIEPSKKALERARLHVNSYIKNDSLISSFPDYFDKIQNENIKSKNGLPVIHIFSNILDVKDIDLKELASKIDKAVVDDNYIISVGPLNPNNKRIDAFYNYYNAPILYDYENTQYDYGGNSTCTYKAKVYKLTYNKQGNLIPIEFYPSVQFHAAYKLDCVNINFNEKQKTDTFLNRLKVFDTSTPFDIGASVYDDIHPVLAVLNNIITRGLPTKASPFIEDVFQKTFNYSQRSEKYGTFSYPNSKNIDVEKVLKWYHSIITKQKALNYSEIDVVQLQLVFSPIAIARIQKTILEALMTDKLDIKSKEWKILVEEKDVPCSALAFADLSEMFNNLTKLSKDFQDLVFPEIKLDIISNEFFVNSELHLNNKNIFAEAKPKLFSIEYDLVIDISVFETSNIEKESFSKFKCKNNCYFNNRSVIQVNSERNIYTTDRIVYRNVVEEPQRGIYTEIDETKELLEYFLRLVFRKEGFRAGQLPILNRALQNKSVIGLLPTGGGKSLTYQLAAMLQPGVTLIVDPLRSLMKDQYDGLINAGIDTCAYINAANTKEEKENAERRMEESKLQFVFLSPERLAIYKFREKLKNMHELNVYFSYGVIDEVHCVSEWGHDFRFSYLHLGRNLYNYVRAKKGEVSLFGLTATASFDVLADVERELSRNGAFPLDSETIVRYENSNRLELQYKIEKVNVEFEYDNYRIGIDNSLPKPVKLPTDKQFKEAKRAFLKEYIKVIPNYINEIQSDESIHRIKTAFKVRQGNNEGIENDLKTTILDNYYCYKSEYEQSGIIFCPHVNNSAISVSENKSSLKGFIPDVGTFTGGDDNDDNSMNNLELFRANKLPLMVATKAFGMGIDKPNVRFTVNLNYSSSLESFVQEAGRGGRDRKMALSVILLSYYRLARISNDFPNKTDVFKKLKGRWFKPENLHEIFDFYKIAFNKDNVQYLTPQKDIVKFSCNKKDLEGNYIFYTNLCSKNNCSDYDKCDLKKVSVEYRNFNSWEYIKDLEKYISDNKLKIDKNNLRYFNSDYETVIYFFDNSFKGELIEKKAMLEILCLKKVKMFYGDDTEMKPEELNTVNGFLRTLENVEEDTEIVTFVKYIPDKLEKEINACLEKVRIKNIFCLKCIAQKPINNENECYEALANFYKRYFDLNDIIDIVDNIKNANTLYGTTLLEKTISKVLEHISRLIICNTHSDLAKAIYRMTCIGLIEDFTQDYANNWYRIVCKRKKEGEYYKGLERFLLRYYSEDRAKEEIQNVYIINVNTKSELEKEIFQCLNYLTTFVYDKISVKRKRAIDDIRTFCITGVNESKDWKETNEDLKDFIYYYFNSKYARRDYKTVDGQDYSIMIDTSEGKESNDKILFKYMMIIEKDFIENKSEPGSTEIDNVKHLQGAVRLLRRSEADNNPTLALLNSFCILFLGTNKNENLEKEVVESYKDGMLEFAKRADRENKLHEFWDWYNEYNEKIKSFSNDKLDNLKNEISLIINQDKLEKITSKYLA